MALNRHALCPPLLLPALLVLTLAPQAARAQEARVTLEVTNAPLSSVLVSLFKSADVRNYVIDSAVGGRVTAALSDVPLSLALRQLLSASATPLTFDAAGGVYHVRVQPPTPPSVVLQLAPAAPPAEDGSAVRFTQIGVRHYDAAMMADLATRPDGIVVVPPNFVVPSIAPALPAGAGRTASGVASPQAGATGANNVLLDGVKHIYAREGDNALVVEATPQGLAELPL